MRLDDSSSDTETFSDDKWSLCFTQPGTINESKLPAMLYKMRIKRDEIFSKFQKKENKFLKKQLESKLIFALEKENIKEIHTFEDHYFDIAKKALDEVGPRKKLLITFIMFSKNPKLTKYALRIYLGCRFYKQMENGEIIDITVW